MKQGKVVLVCTRLAPVALLGTNWKQAKHCPNVTRDLARGAIEAAANNVLFVEGGTFVADCEPFRQMQGKQWKVSPPETPAPDDFHALPTGTEITILLGFPNGGDPGMWKWQRTTATRV